MRESYTYRNLNPLICIALIFLLNLNARSQGPVSNLELPIVQPDEVGIPNDVVTSIHQDILDGQYGLIDHFIIVKDQKLVADYSYTQDYVTIAAQYDPTNHQFNYDHPAWHPFYNNTKLHSLQSVTKSVTSLLIGIAIDKGFIKSVDQPITDFISPSDHDFSDRRKKQITLEDLLTMRSGIQWDEQNYNESDNSCIIMELEDDWIDYVLSQPMDNVPGKRFEYNSGASVLIGKILRSSTNMQVEEWAEEVLFKPLGIQDYYWKKTPLGETDTEGGLYLSSHDLTKIGLLMLSEGFWQGNQIVSPGWITRSVSPHVVFNEDEGYGYQWWVTQHEAKSTVIFSARGYGGQFIMAVPESDLLIIFNGWNIRGGAQKSSYNVLQDRILPSISTRN